MNARLLETHKGRDMADFTGKTIVITGGGTGLGAQHQPAVRLVSTPPHQAA